MTRWLTIILLLCLTTPLLAQGKGKEKKRSKNPPPVAGEKEDESRIVLAFDPGSHTRPITAIGFSADQSQLITVGSDYTIQLWSASSGERRDIIRLPGYGRDNGFDSSRWNHAALSADGAYAAIGGGPKFLYGDKNVPTRLVLVDIVNRQVRKIEVPVDPKASVTCLSFSATGDRLAVGVSGSSNAVYLVDDLHAFVRAAPDPQRPAPPMSQVKGIDFLPHELALSGSGNKLVVAPNKSTVRTFDVGGQSADAWQPLGSFEQPGQNERLEWAPDESHIASTWHNGEAKNNGGLQLRTPDGKPIKEWRFGDLIDRLAITGTLRYIDATRLFVSARLPKDDICVGLIVNTETGETVRHLSAHSPDPFNAIGAVSKSGKLLAIATQKGLAAVVGKVNGGDTSVRCGNLSPLPTIVGWSNDPQNPKIAWTDARLKPKNTDENNLEFGFDLTKFEPMASVESTDFSISRMKQGEWTLSPKGRAFIGAATLFQGDDELHRVVDSSAMTLIPRDKQPPLVAYGAFDKLSGMGTFATVRDVEWKVVAELLPHFTDIRGMAPSPDGRYLLVSTGTHRISVYRTDGSRFPLLNFVQTNGEWICWSPEGYYAASPGGEKLIGWAENKGPNEFAVFHPAEKFAKHFRRPDVLKLAIEKGSLSEALAALKTETRDVEEILPPQCKLKLLKQNGGRIQVQATATSESKDKPVVALRLLLDGRPLAGGIGQKTIAIGEPAEATWELDIPAGNHELKLLARGEESSAVSEPLILKGPKTAGQQPVLHRLCIGVDKYALAALNLTAAAKDATDVFAALEKHCVGTENRFGAARGVLLTDSQATRQAVGKAIVDIRKVAKPGDLVVVFFAGHGIKQQDDYYLLTHEADPSESLKGKSLSGADLRQVLKDIECPVLLMMDSCHSAGGVKSFRPATDDLTRSLTDETAGVTVLAAAMAHEVATSTSENGHFTAAFLRALELSKGTPFDQYEHLLYTHHIYSVIFSDVRKATNGKQNPFLNMPWTVPPLVIRQVPQ
jgi:WD40 repeat protein